MRERMSAALARLSMLVKGYFPKDLQDTLIEMGAELDRLRAEVVTMKATIHELRSKTN